MIRGNAVRDSYLLWGEPAMTSNHLRYGFTIGLFLGFVFAQPASAIDIDNPPAGVFADEWYAVYCLGQKSGHAHASMERVKRDGGDVIRCKTVMLIEVGRAGRTLTITMDEQSTETLDGRPLSFSINERAAMVPTTTEGQIKDGKVHFTKTQMGRTQEAVYDLPEGAMLTWGLYREQMKRGLEPGTKYDLPIYAPSIQPEKLTPGRFEVLAREAIDLFGRKVQTVKTRQTLKIRALLGAETEIENFTWFNEQGQALKLSMSMLAFNLELLACSKTVAMAKNDPAEIMVSTLIPAGRPIDGEKAKAITYRIERRSPESSAKLPSIPEMRLQKIVSQSDTGIVVKRTRASAFTDKAEPAALSREDLALYTANSSILDYKDPEVARLVEKAVGGEKSPRRIADTLCRFVSDYVQTKGLNVGFATASEVARSKEGDCTEHGILLAAMGRGAGLPTRVVIGVVYTDRFADQRDVFVGHMWTQFHIDGRWVDLDAAFHQTDVDATHIAFGASPAGDSAMADIFASFFQVMGGLKITPQGIE